MTIDMRRAPLETSQSPQPQARWLPLHDAPAGPLAPLHLSLHQLEVHGLARHLVRALHLNDPADLAGRLLGEHANRLSVHGPHLTHLTGSLPPAMARAFAAALGATLPDTPTNETAGNRRPNLSLLRLPTLRREAQRPHATTTSASLEPAARLHAALQELASGGQPVSAFNAALTTSLLRSMTRHWLDDQSALHLELLCHLRTTPEGATTGYGPAVQHVRTTLTGTRRQAALLLIHEAREQHRALLRHRDFQAQARRQVIRATMTAARHLHAHGHLRRTADARWLHPTELCDALDGLLDPRTLQGLAEARRTVLASDAPTTSLLQNATTVTGLPLCPGVRDGTLHVQTPGEPVPTGTIVFADHLDHWTLPALKGAGALILTGAAQQGRAAQFSREHTLPTITVDGRIDWLEPGALVRLNAHQGTVTLLRRAGAPPLAPAPFDLNLTGTTVSTHVRVLPRPTPISLDF